jgi:two-component system response regulator PilR (NtrC family)
MNPKQQTADPKPRVLVVDDEPMLRRVVSRMVAATGCEAVEAEGIADARVALATQRFDAVLSDIALADGSGLDLAAELIAARGPAVALMSGSIEALEQARQTLGVLALSKPLDAAQLREALVALGVAITPG